MKEWVPTISTEDGPKYRAIVRALAEDVRSGRLPPGAQLPPQRVLAKQLNVDLTTITRAFNEARKAGLIDATVGRGSFVRGGPASTDELRKLHPSASVDFSMNMPPQPAAAKLVERIQTGLASLTSSPGIFDRLQYQDSAGNLADRAIAAEWLRQRLGPLPVQRVLIAGGAQTALTAILAVVLKPGDVLCVPTLTYPGLRTAAERHGVRLVTVARDTDGIDPEAFQACCQFERPKAIYLVPTLDNPTTATLPASRRAKIADIACAHDVTIIEDDAYGVLPPDAPPPIAAIAGDITWHVATLSKCISPSLRVAYVVAPGTSDAVRLSTELRTISMMAPPLSAALASHWISQGELHEIVTAIRKENGARQAIARETLIGLDYQSQPCGHHLWLKLPAPWQRGELSAHARRLGLTVISSDAFAVGPAPEAIRVSLGAEPDRETLRYGLSVLATLLTHPPGAISTVV